MAKKKKTSGKLTTASVGKRETSRLTIVGYDQTLNDIGDLLNTARRETARAVNTVMTLTYWEIGRRLVEFEQGGKGRAEYGKALLKSFADDLTRKFGRGFSVDNLENMRKFYLAYQPTDIGESLVDVGEKQKSETPSRISATADRFPLPWSHYVTLLAVKKDDARKFYEAEALRGGWTVKQLKRQIGSQFFERTLLSKNKIALIRKGQVAQVEDAVTPEEEIKDPFLLEFLNLKDEYSENDLEAALIHKLETFLLELGNDFAFVGRQRRLRIGNKWFRIDLLLFHRRLRSLIIIDLKLGEFSYADVGQINLYCNYAKEHWTLPDENPPVGLILCASKDHTEAKYALEGLSNQVLAAEYLTTLPEEEAIIAELEQTRKTLEGRIAEKAEQKTH